SAELDFTSCWAAGTQSYRVEMIGIVPATDKVSILIQVSTNGGMTYDTGNNYAWVGFRQSTSGTVNNSGSNATTSWGMDALSGITNSTTTGSMGADITLWFPSNASAYRVLFTSRGFAYDGGVTPNIFFTSSGIYKSTTVPNA